MISAKINVSKIDKTALFKGEKGTYLDITLMENRDGPDEYGNDFFIVQDIGKVRREAGERGPIIGNAKKRGAKPVPQNPAAKPAPSTATEDPDDIRF